MHISNSETLIRIRGIKTMEYLKSYVNTSPECNGDGISVGQDGIPVNFLEFDIQALTAYFTIDRIANALARNYRYAGESKFSVAFHCIRMADVLLLSGNPIAAKQALFHELAEVVLGDLRRPVKKIVSPLFKPVETEFERVLCQIWGVPYPFQECVHILDTNISMEEMWCMKCDKIYPYQYPTEEAVISLFKHTWHKIDSHLAYAKSEIVK
jgi:hypothetical protein